MMAHSIGMKSAGHLAGLLLAATPPGALFLAQSWLLAGGRSEAMLPLAKYGGLLSLLFFVFDGNSGLVPAMLQRRHEEAAVRSAYFVYRMGILAILALSLPGLWLLAPQDLAALLPFLAPALLLRLPFLDVGLDRQGMQHWSMLLQNGWMLPLSLAAVLTGTVGPETAGHAALLSALFLAATHLRFVAGTHDQTDHAKTRAALSEILPLAFAQGLSQLYGRTVLFALGAGFSGPLASLAIYAKQAFNATGVLVTYLRRLELTRGARSMRLSLSGQAVIGLIAGLLVTFAAIRLDLLAGGVLVLLAWQIFEKLSSNALYALQLGGLHASALSGLLAILGLGFPGLVTAVSTANVLVFVIAETVGYGSVLLLWLWHAQGRRPGLETPP